MKCKKGLTASGIVDAERNEIFKHGTGSSFSGGSRTRVALSTFSGMESNDGTRYLQTRQHMCMGDDH